MERAANDTLRIAYADPPYIGCAHRYTDTDSHEVNHRLLIAHLCEYDGWALSCHSPSLRELLPMCPEKARVAAWVKPWCSWRPGMRVSYAWEPVIFCPARTKSGRDIETTRDWVSVSANGSGRRGILGAKPDGFSFWLFNLLGAEREDDFHDIFPGSGAVRRAWDAWSAQITLYG